MGEGAKNLTNPGVSQGIGDLYAGMGAKGAGALGITALTAADSLGRGKGYKESKPTWFMYGDATTPGFDPVTQRYGPATTTQDPKVLREHLLAQSQTTPPPAPPAPASVYDTFQAARGGYVPDQEVSLADYFAAGGEVPPSSRFLSGPGDGVSDSIPAQIDGQQPAALGDGEFVVDARTVAELGNGSSAAGAKALYAMVDRVHAMRKKALLGKDSGAKQALPA
jgi:hypothetical protein